MFEVNNPSSRGPTTVERELFALDTMRVNESGVTEHCLLMFYIATSSAKVTVSLYFDGLVSEHVTLEVGPALTPTLSFILLPGDSIYVSFPDGQPTSGGAPVLNVWR